MLYLIATPIGNLADFSFRAVETLQRCDYVLCEDTRHSLTLLQHYQIKKRLLSYHAFNESKQLETVISDLQKGMHIALISDAGTPLLADPGFPLVQRCRETGIPVTAVPGANAAITALILSGFPPLPFQCVGFLPKKSSELSHLLIRILTYKGTTLCYETPHRLVETLAHIDKFAPARLLSVARELTKIHEESLRGTAAELHAHFTTVAPRGEIVLLFAPPPSEIPFEELSLKELVSYLQTEFSLGVSDAIKLAAELHGVPKKKVYNTYHDLHS